MLRHNKWTTRKGSTIYQILSGRCNCYLLSNGKRAIIVDTGVKGEWKKLYRRIIQLCAGELTLEALILTHTHFDHAANTQRVKETFQSEIIVQQDEAAYLERGSSPIPRGTMFFTRTLVHLAGDRELPFARFTPSSATVVFDDHYSLSEFGFEAYILHTPGHSKGSCCVIVDDEIALVGDTMVGIITGIIFPPFADRPDQVISSWGKLLATGCELFLPAHGTRNDRETVEKHYQIYKNRLNKEHRR